MWEIKGKDNQVKATVGSLEYNGEWMGESYVTVTVESPAPVNFEIGDYIIYRDERFEINYDPGKIKSAPRYEKGDAFKYENIKFNSLADELTRCDFLDIVLNDNQLHFTGLPKFSFYGGVKDLANRMQANLDRTYGKGTWSVVVSPEFQSTKEVNISVDTIKVQGALSILVNELETYYTIKDRTITIGAAGIPAGHLFKYGRGNGLYEIEQNAEADQAIVTRLRAYGSTRNLPHRYYNSLSGADGKKLIPDNMAVQYLMLPEFPYTTQDPYIDSPNIAKLGIREGTVFFDGSGELEEIYPSIEGMTAEQLKAAGVPCNSTGALDEIVSAEQMTDNGVGEINEGETQTTAKPPTFKVTLKDLGFDIWEHRIAGTTPVISFKTGMLGGRDFEIVGCKKIESGGKVTGYELELNRVYDDDIKLWFPYSAYNAQAGDKFVLLYIEMPEVYIKAAAQRLKEAATEWLSKNDYSRSIYAPKVDEIFMARQHNLAMASGGKIKSLHDTLKEGMLLLFEDEDLNIDASIFIDRLTIKEEGAVPTYEVVLKEEKTVGRLDKMQNQIDSLVAGKGQGGGGYTAAQIRALIEAYGGTRFLSKIADDRTPYKISTDAAFEVGKYLAGSSGGILGMDANLGDSFAEVARLYVRVKAYFEELTVIKAGVLAGRQYITPGGGIKCVRVEEKGLVDRNIPLSLERDGCMQLENGGYFLSEQARKVDNGVPDGVYRCWFLSEQDGEKIECKFIQGDLAISEMFNAQTGTSNKISNRRYWRLVTAVENSVFEENGNRYGYIDLSKTKCEDGSDAPQAGDEICQFGHAGSSDIERQTAMVFSTIGADAPSIKLYANINKFSLDGKAVIIFGRNPITGAIYFRLGTDGAAQYLEYNQDKGLEVAGAISSQSTIGGKGVSEFVAGIVKEEGTVITDKKVEYVAAAQGSVPPRAVEWQDAVPPVPEGWYLWTRVTLTYSDGTHTVAYSVSRMGKDGTTIVEESVRYAVTDTAEQPSDVQFRYIKVPPLKEGDYLWSRHYIEYSDGSSTASYSVSRVGADGAEGIPGPAGADGRTSYVHFAYASGVTGALPHPTAVEGFSTTAFASARYIGVCSDFSQPDPTDHGAYQWSEYRSADGGGVNLLRNTDFIDGLAFWTPNADVFVDNAYLLDGRPSAHLLRNAGTNDFRLFIHQDIDVEREWAGRTFTLSAYLRRDSSMIAIDKPANLEIRFLDSSSNRITTCYGAIPADGDGEWRRVTASGVCPANARRIAAFVVVQNDGEFLLNGMKLEIGGIASEWSPAPRDTSYLRSALRESATINGGLILATLLKCGYTGEDGQYRVMAGVNGAANMSGGRDIAFFAGGDTVDAENAGGQSPATFVVRHDGSAYACGNTVRFEANRMEIGDNLEIDAEGLYLKGEDGAVKLKVTNSEVWDGVDGTSSTLRFSRNLSGAIAIGRTGTSGTGGVSASPRHYVMTGRTFTDITFGQALTAGSNVTGAVGLSFTLSGDFANYPMAATANAAIYRKSGTSLIRVYQQQGRFSTSGSTHTCNISINATLAQEGEYLMRVTIPATPLSGGVTAGTATASGSASGKVSLGVDEQTIIGNNGIMTIWPELKMVASRKDGKGYFGALVGNYGLRITPAGFEKTTDGQTWVKANI